MIHRELAMGAESTFDAPTRASQVEGTVGSLVAGKYRVERLLGQGGMGVVVAARHQQLDQLVALKLLNDAAARDPDGVGRFLREGRLASRLRSEHVARVLDVGTLRSGSPFLVLEYLEGRDLGAEVEERGPLPIAEAVDLILQALEALAEAHALGIVHRDLKPSNLLLTRRPDGSALVKVLDFGLSKNMVAEVDQPALTQSTTGALGSPLYMAPELVRSALAASPASDQWSIGVTLFELLTNDAPFVGESIGAILAAIVADRPRPLQRPGQADEPAIVSALGAVLSRCLEKVPGDRYPDVAALAEALAPFGSPSARSSAERVSATLGFGGSLEGAKGAATPREERASRPAGRWRARAAAVAAAGLLAAGALWTAFVLGGREAAPLPAERPSSLPAPEPAADPSPTAPPSATTTAVTTTAMAEAGGVPGTSEPTSSGARPTAPTRRPPPAKASAIPPAPPSAGAPSASAPSARSVEDLLGKGRL